MPATPAPAIATAGPRGLSIAGLRPSGDVILALGVVAMLVVLIAPLPTWLLDIGLACSITLSVLVLLVSLMLEQPLDFSSFPTVLLVSTILRLALNVASTRLILSDGHNGTAAAGHVIEAFGGFLMSGNLVIGAIVFAILVLVNFVVITKGSGRIAEVAARFSLDAMPGKQMAVDADLSAGLIDEAEAKRRRRALEEESAFFGAMDGAAKFVRGDAVAGLVVTLINILGGITIGVAQQGLSFAQSARSYTLLTIGDGLVSQIPALLVSTAAGIVVTKASTAGTADRALARELGTAPKPLALAAAAAGALALMPGLPAMPFLVLAGAAAALAAWRWQGAGVAEAAALEASRAAAGADAAEEPASAAARLDLVRIELGYGLLGLVNTENGPKLTDQIRALRRSLAAETGFIAPSVRLQDNMQLPANAYVIRVKEIEAGRGELRPNMLLVMDPRGAAIELPGEATREPTFGLPALWVDEGRREEAMFRGLTVVDPASVLTTHLTEILREQMAEILSYAETQKLLDEIGAENRKLVADLVPAQITVATVQRVLQALLAERVAIRDLPTILEAMAEAGAGGQRALPAIVQHVRTRLARQISDQHAGPDGAIPLVVLSPDWEQAFAEALSGQGEERVLAMAPSRLQGFMAAVRDAFEAAAREGHAAALLTGPAIRAHVRAVVERFRPLTPVLAQSEIHPKARLRTLRTI
ncbi:MAG: flagellar biosynthesis protein FlhA [Alphaproteobacteria bacterium]|nr:flagellar biosynthesis protein FlhA [Alphaproteobacteria bacterium]